MIMIRPLMLSMLIILNGSAYAATLVDLSQADKREVKSSAYQLKLLKKSVDRAGNTHIRYEQTYQGMPVFGYHLIEHQYSPSLRPLKLPVLTGIEVSDLEQDLPAPRFKVTDPQESLDRFKAAYIKQHGSDLVFNQEVARTVIMIDQKDRAVLAHEINFFVDSSQGGQPARPHYLVEANTGKILKQWEGLTTEHIGQGPGGNERIGYYFYGKDRPTLDITRLGHQCFMIGEGGQTVHANYRFDFDTNAYVYKCRKPFIQDQDAANGAASPLNDAHYFIDVLTQFYQTNYQTAPLPFPLLMRVHYGKQYANAFWDGSSMTFGDGDTGLYPLVLLDIAGHEIAHGVTEVNSDLIYEGQPGGMNEAFSDMAGKVIEYFVYGSNNWAIGAGVFKDPAIKGLRFMDNPPADGISIDHVSDYNEGLDVHYSSGVYNKAFYLLATTPGWNTGSAFDLMYYANVAYWQPNSTFATGAWGVVQTALALGRNVQDVVNAFQQVGIQCDLDKRLCIQ